MKRMQNVQANILKSHGRKHNWFLFIQFNQDQDPIAIRRQMVDLYFRKQLKPRWINTAAAQLNDSLEYSNADKEEKERKQEKFDGTVVASLAFSKKGLAKMNVTEWRASDVLFQNGMSDIRRNNFQDPPVKEWESAFQNEIHAVLITACNSIKKLEVLHEQIKAQLRPIANVLFIEKGQKMTRGDYSIEPFGFRDSISNPRFFTKKSDGSKYDCLEDKLEIALDEADGSYLVFRKLEQDVEAFNQAVSVLSKRLKISRAFAEAQLIGRFKDGTPLSLFSEPGNDISQSDREKRNYFDNNPDKGYDDDEDGRKCPFHAHIRKVNPRSFREVIFENDGYASASLNKNTFGKIVRRGIPYEQAGQSAGLLFLCYQSSIRGQFSIVQKDWCNRHQLELEKDNEKIVGIDPVVGQFKNELESPNSWKMNWNEKPGRKVYLDFLELVTFKGGEYFYAPSVKNLKKLIDAEEEVV